MIKTQKNTLPLFSGMVEILNRDALEKEILKIRTLEKGHIKKEDLYSFIKKNIPTDDIGIEMMLKELYIKEYGHIFVKRKKESFHEFISLFDINPKKGFRWHDFVDLALDFSDRHTYAGSVEREAECFYNDSGYCYKIEWQGQSLEMKGIVVYINWKKEVELIDKMIELDKECVF